MVKNGGNSFIKIAPSPDFFIGNIYNLQFTILPSYPMGRGDYLYSRQLNDGFLTFNL
jgi:hypothetical protein